MTVRLDALLPQPPWRLAGGSAIACMTLLRPLDAADSVHPGVRLWPRAAPAIDLDANAATPPLRSMPRAMLAGHLLVLYPAGSFVATDGLRLAAAEMDGPEWRFAWAVRRVVNQNLEPAPARLCVLLALDGGGDGPQCMSFGFRHTGAAGAPRPGEPSIPTLLLELQ